MPMAGESPSARPDDIEELLRQAQAAAGVVPESAPAEEPVAVGPKIGPASGPLQPPAASTSVQPRSQAAAAAVASHPASQAPQRSAASVTGDDISFLLAQAEQAIASVDQPADPALSNLTPFQFKDLTASPPSGEKATLELLKDVDLDLRIELGRTHMYLEDVLKLKRGAVVALEKLAGDPVDVFVNGRIVARGEVLVLNDNFCVRVTELLAGDDFD
jgi:flagellar motor switch protein FliN/FliY